MFWKFRDCLHRQYEVMPLSKCRVMSIQYESADHGKGVERTPNYTLNKGDYVVPFQAGRDRKSVVSLK